MVSYLSIGCLFFYCLFFNILGCKDKLNIVCYCGIIICLNGLVCYRIGDN